MEELYNNIFFSLKTW